MNGTCRLCGREGDGIPFDEWVKPTFVNWDDLLPGDIVCNDCLFWFDEKSEDLARRMGKEKPQRMRTYSHFIKNGTWIPLSKAHKRQMLSLLTEPPFPELAAISVTGQKHIVFRARRNASGQDAGWVQFEEQPIFVQPRELSSLVSNIESLLNMGFSKAEVETGNYSTSRIRKAGIDAWWNVEQTIRNRRGSAIFSLALFLSQKEAS